MNCWFFISTLKSLNSLSFINRELCLFCFTVRLRGNWLFAVKNYFSWAKIQTNSVEIVNFWHEGWIIPLEQHFRSPTLTSLFICEVFCFPSTLHWFGKVKVHFNLRFHLFSLWVNQLVMPLCSWTKVNQSWIAFWQTYCHLHCWRCENRIHFRSMSFISHTTSKCRAFWGSGWSQIQCAPQ